ncbi:hypothetical protein bb8_p14 [Bordetella phage vB_BbrP_BB8]|uniref:Uncharacterized protein n=1 Tax=Bordetella phage vB_BbrP_BB8 TaxID=2587820 RepID=A0A4Y5TPM9_9CAUD|nr:hypothetical protein bb8_p14 [Bordetella phage vB_BbrP_BB8]
MEPLMKRTVQMKKGNVHRRNSVASVPRNEPYPRPVRRVLKAMKRTPVTMPKWAVTSNLLDWMLYRAGVYQADVPEGAA